MTTFSYDPKQTDARVRAALELIAADFPIRPAARGKANLVFTLDASANGPSISRAGRVTTIAGANVPHLLRGLATVRGFDAAGSVPRHHHETAAFTTLGLMQDMSRHAVMRPAAVEAMLRRIALMGMNMFMLYTEDTYDIPSQPYFGYMRGRYTHAELRRIDDYAHVLGIEVVPCIQTLGHLWHALKHTAFNDVRSTSDILLVGEPKTYALIEEMFAATTACFRTKRIHIGMDEAHDVQGGRYEQINGKQSGFQVMNRHMAEVVKITDRLGLKPMIWSDMYFRIGSKTGDYYDRSGSVPAEVAAKIPKQIDLVYWDYYHADVGFYAEWIDRHRAMGKEPIFAGGAWMWNLLWPNYDITSLCTRAAMTACRDRKVREALVTAWGDNGNESDAFANLPNLQLFADCAFDEHADAKTHRRQFAGSTGGDFDAWLLGGLLDRTPGILSLAETYGINKQVLPDSVEAIASGKENYGPQNPPKYLLWQDPMLGVYDAHVGRLPLDKHYAKLAKDLAKALRKSPVDRERLTHASNLASVLALKADIGVRLYDAYHAKGATRTARLRELHRSVLPELAKRVERLYDHHRALWLANNKSQGWEILESRYASLLARVRFAHERVGAFLAGRVDQLEELEEKRLPIHTDWGPGRLGLCGDYRRMYSPTFS